MKSINFVIFAIVFLFIFNNICLSQTESQNLFIGGSFGIASQNNDSHDSLTTLSTSNVTKYTYSIIPKLGYSISNNWAIGAGLNYSSSPNSSDYKSYVNYDNSPSNQDFNEYTYNYNDYNTQCILFSRYYFELSNRFFLFLECDIGYTLGKTSEETKSYQDGLLYSDINYNTSSYGYNIGINPGITYFISKNFSLEASLGAISYSYIHKKNDNEINDNYTKYNILNFNINLTTINLGILYYF